MSRPKKPAAPAAKKKTILPVIVALAIAALVIAIAAIQIVK